MLMEGIEDAIDKEMASETSVQVDTEPTDNEVNEDDDGGEVSGPRRPPAIELAKRPSCKFCLYSISLHPFTLLD
jgi:hypothetical protein